MKNFPLGRKEPLTFAKTMLAGNIGKIFYLANSGNGYDTHQNELTTMNLNGGIGYLAQAVTEFFNQVKSTEQITIVIYSEFGRTNAMNGTAGTDHGQGGGMFVISNDPNVQSSMTGSIYGKSDIQKEKNNWMSPGIDYRSIYGKVLGSIFGIPNQGFFTKFYGSLEDDLSIAPSSIKLLRTQHRAISDTQVEISMKYKVDDKNFDITKSSYAIASYGTGMSFLEPYSQPFYVSYSGMIRSDNTTYSRITRDTLGTYTFNPALVIGKRFIENTPFVYTLGLVNNQLSTTYFTGTTAIPEAITASVSQISLTGSSILRKYDNKTYSGTTLLTGSGVFLKNNTGTGDMIISNYNGVTITVHSGITQGTSLVVNTGSVLWNGGFILGETLNPVEFIPKEAMQFDDTILLSNFTINRLIRIGSDTLGIDMRLNKSVSLSLTGFIPNTGYLIMSSADGYDWKNEFSSVITTNSGGILVFPTNHLSLFAVVQVPSLPVCSLSATRTLMENGATSNLQWSTLYADTVSIDQGINIVASSGSTLVSPAPSNTTNYILSATNINGTTNCNASIETRSLPSCTIGSTNSNIKVGTSTYLAWTGSNADTSILSPWNTPAPIIGSRAISPTIDTPYSLEVSNSVGSGSCTTMVTTFPNTIPVANPDNVSITGSTLTRITVLVNDVDTDSGDTISINNITTPTHGIASISGDQIIYTATSAYCGSDTLDYTISDNYNGISIPATVSITVNCIPDTIGPVIVLFGSGNMNITRGSGFIDPGATCTDNVDMSCTVTSTGTPDTNTLGIYIISYGATDVARNSSTASRNVHVISGLDTIAPVITLSGSSNMDITQGSGFIDPGATCTDNVDMSCTVTSTGSPNTSTLGTYIISYGATDVAGNSGTITRNVNVVNTPDTIAPMIILVGSGNMDITQGSGFIDPGATCTDNVDMSCTVTSTGSPNTSTLGTYIISYGATDVAGNSSTRSRHINVIAASGGSGSGNITTSVTYTAITITSTGSALISGSPLNFANGSSLNLINANILLTASGGSISLSGSVDIRVSSGTWNATLSAPVIISSISSTAISLQDQGVLQNLPQDEIVSENVFRQYIHTVVGTFKAGGNNAGLSLSGANALMKISLPSLGSGTVVQVLRSEDGQNWDTNSPGSTCTIDERGLCSFYTDHFTYFGAIQSVGSISINSFNTISGAGGGGGGVLSVPSLMDYSLNPSPHPSPTPSTSVNQNVILIPKIGTVLAQTIKNNTPIFRLSLDTLLSSVHDSKTKSIYGDVKDMINRVYVEIIEKILNDSNPQKQRDYIVSLLSEMKKGKISNFEKFVVNTLISQVTQYDAVQKTKVIKQKSVGPKVTRVKR